MTFLFFIGLIACQQIEQKDTITAISTLLTNTSLLQESAVQGIPLVGPISESRAEISGMAWCGEDLILLPQYPHLFSEDGTDRIFSISREILDDYFSGKHTDGIMPELIPFETGGLEQTLVGFEGFEAIVFNGVYFYVTIEAREAGGMMGYLVKGEVDENCDGFRLDPGSVTSLESQADISNISHETLVIYGEELYAIYEANGINVNPNPVAHKFDESLISHTTIDMPNIEYRLTDATQSDETGAFWVINYFYPGDAGDLDPAIDQITLDYGLGASHQDADPVERLIRLRVGQDKIILEDQQPIYLELMEEDSRNWEGIVQYGEGFMLVTDKFPTTILAYIEESGLR